MRILATWFPSVNYEKRAWCMHPLVLTVCVCPALQHPEHDRLYLEDAFTSHNISHSALEVLLDTCLQNLPSGTHPPPFLLQEITICNKTTQLLYCKPSCASRVGHCRSWPRMNALYTLRMPLAEIPTTVLQASVCARWAPARAA